MRLVRNFIALICVAMITGCAVSPKPHVDTSWYTQPSEGKAGIYVYQWKTGIHGAISDVKFVLNDQVMTKLNTGEWDYFEVSPGVYEFRLFGGPFPQTEDLTFEAGKNYFFQAALANAMDMVLPVYNEEDIREAIENIKSGRYEKADVD